MFIVAPTMTTTSASGAARCAYGHGYPVGSSSATKPRPKPLPSTGIPRAASALRPSVVSPHAAPSPTTTIGFSAPLRSCTALDTWAASAPGSTTECFTMPVRGTGIGFVIMSIGSTSSAGPGVPSVAALQAAWKYSSMRSAEGTVRLNLMDEAVNSWRSMVMLAEVSIQLSG
ncbi:hypothetical protein BX600DRAFT_476027, partial [Xylariales sp. PMI_506]